MIKIVKLTKNRVENGVERLKEIDRLIWDEEGNWKEGNFLKDLPGKWEHSFVVFDNNKIVGYGICSLKEGLYIHRFAIDGEHQGRGVGKELLKKIVEEAKTSNLKSISCQVKKFNIVAQRFYERFGFEKIGENGINYVYRRSLEKTY